jgi:type IV secretory pathway VirB10-like protein
LARWGGRIVRGSPWGRSVGLASTAILVAVVLAPVASASGPAQHETSRNWLAGLVALLGLIGMGAIFGISMRGREKGGTDVREFRRQGRNDKHQADVENGASAPVQPEAVAPHAEPPAEHVVEQSAADLGNVGEHIASVLGAAEAAAARLREDAELEARRLVDEAEERAKEIRSRAREESQSVRTSAQQILDEAEATSAEVRTEADRYAESRRREADAQAAKLVVEAEQKAAAIADASRERHRVVLSNIATSEARLRDLAKSLRGVASALDTVVGGAQEGKRTVGDGNGDSLEETLRPRTAARRKEEAANQ